MPGLATDQGPSCPEDVEQEHVDLQGMRPRLLRLLAAVGLSAVLTALVLGWMRSVSGDPGADPVSGGTVGFVAILIFVFGAVVISGVLAAVAKRLR
jgi:hypothetical protein